MEKEIIREAGALPPVYSGALTNHMPMVLTAMSAMGATVERMADYAETAKQRIQTQQTTDSGAEIDADNWREFRGLHQHYQSLTRFFTAEIAKMGKDRTLKLYLGFLLPGIVGGGFHGIIRLAYAALTGEEDQIARALAYWADIYQEVPVYAPSGLTADPLGRLKELSRNEHFRTKALKGSNISERIAEIAADPQFAAVMTDLHTPLIGEESNRNLVKAVYALTEDFTMLHGLTAFHAIHVLKPWWRDYVIPLRIFWRYIQAAYLSTGCAPFADHLPAVTPGLTWEDLKKQALESNDDHTVKLVYTCWQEFGTDHDDLFMELAHRRLRKTRERD